MLWRVCSLTPYKRSACSVISRLSSEAAGHSPSCLTTFIWVVKRIGEKTAGCGFASRPAVLGLAALKPGQSLFHKGGDPFPRIFRFRTNILGIGFKFQGGT